MGFRALARLSWGENLKPRPKYYNSNPIIEYEKTNVCFMKINRNVLFSILKTYLFIDLVKQYIYGLVFSLFLGLKFASKIKIKTSQKIENPVSLYSSLSYIPVKM